jgi:hypothetical protein
MTAKTPTGNDLVDKLGPIPEFPPRQLDEHGRLVPLSPDEKRARSEAAIRVLQAIGELSDEDPPGIEADFMRGIDENRAPGQKIFEGLGLYRHLVRFPGVEARFWTTIS